MPEGIEQKVPVAEQKSAPETSPEQISSSEQTVEQTLERQPTQQAEQIQTSEVVMPQTASTQPTQQITQDQIVLEKVETILTEDLDQVFLSMDANTQQQFKLKGEETVQKIGILLQQATVKAKDIVTIILEWLRIIPKVNKHYIEQEAKIKTDHIMNMHNQKQK